MRILKYPHPTLRHRSKPVRRVDSELKAMVHRMFDLMYAQQGIGLAANQVDLPYRLFVMNLQAPAYAGAKEQEYALINPVIVKQKGWQEQDEGCLSFPDISAPVLRAEKILVNAYTLDGQEVSWELEGLHARAVQHECDHLDGVLFIDRLSPARLLAIKQDLMDLEAEFAGDRRLGLIPEDHLIAARLAELELART